jgi:hypothetical protein
MWGVRRWTRFAHAHHASFRVDELNSIACGGKAGLSDTFASALWALDTLFQAAHAGVDGVNLHTFPGARYAPFAFSQRGGRWLAVVHPEYYGLLLFGEAAPAGSRLLPVTVAGPKTLRVWATVGPGPSMHVLLINDSASTTRLLVLRMPGGASHASVARLQAPGLLATTGVTLAGQTFGASTGTGILSGQPTTTVLAPVRGAYAVRLPPASAALLTFSQAPVPAG